ncbi:trehalase-like domain-containing protein, partial [Burkholderia pseudomallei]
HTASLITPDGTVDWLCWPPFDTAACFAPHLGTPEHGRCLVAPADDVRVIATSRRYLGDTLILETDYECDEVAVTVID